MTTKQIILSAFLVLPLPLMAQGNNTGLGGEDGDVESLAHRVLKLEKKNDALNIYFNYAASFQENYDGDRWGSSFKNKQARLEIKGTLGKHLSYRFRHRLNKGNQAQSEDNFAKATDILMVGWQFNDKWSIQAGKMCQNWGGYEFDENPMYIYQYSDMVDYMDNFMTGVNVSFKPVPTQEFAINITDAYNNSFSDEYGAGATSLEQNAIRHLEKSNHPLAYIGLWSGSFFGDKLQTRWSYGVKAQARHKYSKQVMLGQKLNLPRLQWYFDYMMTNDALDRQRIASTEGAAYLAQNGGAGYFSDVKYNSFITKMNWQFAPKCNLMLKGGYETASVSKVKEFNDYRKAWMYIGSLEYYPVKQQDFRVFLAYVGRHYDYSKSVAQFGLNDYSTSRIELGFMYRIKVY